MWPINYTSRATCITPKDISQTGPCLWSWTCRCSIGNWTEMGTIVASDIRCTALVPCRHVSSRGPFSCFASFLSCSFLSARSESTTTSTWSSQQPEWQNVKLNLVQLDQPRPRHRGTQLKAPTLLDDCLPLHMVCSAHLQEPRLAQGHD